MSGASMWLDAQAGADSSNENAVVNCSTRTSGFIGVTSNSGLSSDSPPEHPKLRRQQREAQCARFACVAGGVGGPTIGGGDHRGMQKEAAVFGAFRQRASHQRRGFIDLSGSGECPRQCVEREHVLTVDE